jgi:hypothetical protein
LNVQYRDEAFPQLTLQPFSLSLTPGLGIQDEAPELGFVVRPIHVKIYTVYVVLDSFGVPGLFAKNVSIALVANIFSFRLTMASNLGAVWHGMQRVKEYRDQ